MGGGGWIPLLLSSNVGGGISGWWEDVLWPSSSPSELQNSTVVGRGWGVRWWWSVSYTDAAPGEKAAFLFLVALVSRATGCCCWSFWQDTAVEPAAAVSAYGLPAAAAMEICCCCSCWLLLFAGATCCCWLLLVAEACCSCWLLLVDEACWCSWL